jgi:hypothetical protein
MNKERRFAVGFLIVGIYDVLFLKWAYAVRPNLQHSEGRTPCR